ncbi:DUF4255 domain-containing protein [Streptomyces sp. SL13]|uniref:DUF4255 domain-containing protein n=1 Tax=Streptantibioticus silvisoli TaxID=2705255 RepID=A0AA90K9B8_9ACTN|nr:DUF4255 domain-containing protein [Streptantibioticus silvisoli]MDI5970963.1 DUF4255 domain-containing protein [Streptantibioticus silvisoli]
MIHEVDEALRLLLTGAGLCEGGVELVFDPPTRDWAARRNAPTVSVFLHGIREEAARRQAGESAQFADDGTIAARLAVPRWFELAYLVTAWTNRPQDEHRLLSDVLRCLVRHDCLPPALLTGSLAELGLTVALDTSARGENTPAVSDVWSALGGELKPSVDLRVLAPLSGARTPAAPAVTDGLVVRAAPPGAPDGEAVPGRRLRYAGAGEAGAGDARSGEARKGDARGGDARADGFAAGRDRPPPPGRRRRHGPER